MIASLEIRSREGLGRIAETFRARVVLEDSPWFSTKTPKHGLLQRLTVECFQGNYKAFLPALVELVTLRIDVILYDFSGLAISDSLWE